MPVDSFLTAGERPSGGGGGAEYPSPSPSPGPPSLPEYADYISAARDGLGDMSVPAFLVRCPAQKPREMTELDFQFGKDAVEAKDCLMFDARSEDDLISNYLNGPRILSDECMSYILISNPMESIYDDGHSGQFELLMCAPHFIGDGASLHQCTHEFMTLLASPQSSSDLLQILTLPLNWIHIPSSGIARAAASELFAKPCTTKSAATPSVEPNALLRKRSSSKNHSRNLKRKQY
ncbi:hypothetical protein D9757_013155 [Collybiopsis confluens]|uniref:Uncharacterized protein n=1 Tax=Collybiopsis confluens TaxID=2823264 RepID=A0A8H5D8C7_9AGAR|nr:hypothetical protein D9757_013155 [Collybiopsis confluens]